MKSTRLISKEIDEFYTNASEETRLQYGLGPLEFERNKELIQRYLSKNKMIILDIGGGTGIYAEWMAGLGHEVHLVDPVLKHIRLAKQKASKAGNFFHCWMGEAQKLNFSDELADVVILHGPLYHLQQRQSRIRAINEAKRVLKKDGIILGFAISYAASAIVGLLNGYIHDENFFEMCSEELITGFHDPLPDWYGSLPPSYFHKPEELQEEFETCKLTCLDILAIEGIAWLDKTYFESMGNAIKKQQLMRLIKITEKERSLLGISPHVVIVGKK